MRSAWLMATRWARIVTIPLSFAVGGSCGNESDLAVPASAAESSGEGSLEVVAESFGRAFFSRDFESIYGGLPPDSRELFGPEARELFDAVGAPVGNVTLDRFAFDLTMTSSVSATATYSGRVCSPEVTFQSPTTTQSGGNGAESPPEPSATLGDVECTDIADLPGGLSQVRFVLVEGKWYGTLPGVP
jgi:hypothetical protein